MDASEPPPISPVPQARVKRKPWVLYIFGGLVVFFLAIIATVLVTLWWIQRPIRPVVLSDKEKTVLDTKLTYLENPDVAPRRHPGLRKASTVAEVRDAGSADNHTYVPGDKVITLTQREINGLLNANTDLGHSVRLEFDTDAINAYLAVPIPQDFPIGGGKMFRARGRFRLSIEEGGTPYAVLEDVTVFGLSLPNAWLGGIKGQNLFADALHGSNGGPLLRGVKSLRLQPGALVLEVEN